MFFPRLRRHTKWMFVFLALVFGLGFVLFGIGATGTGIGDVLRDAGGTGGGPSINDSREKVADNPRDAEAWRDLSTAYQTDGDTAQAVAALERYVDLRPRDADGLRELGGLLLVNARESAQAAELAQYRASFASGGAGLIPGLSVNGQPVLTDPIATAVQSTANLEVQRLYGQAQDAFSTAVATYTRLAQLSPNDPTVQLELAQAAEQAGNRDAAIGAYQAFLKLAPDDPNAPIVRQQLRQLRSSS